MVPWAPAPCGERMASQGAKVPRLVPGVDLTKLPLSPLEGFVLSRIDGVASIAVLADLTSLDEGQVNAIVERIIDLGAAEWARESVSLPRATGRTPMRTPSRPFTVPEVLRTPPPPSQRAARPMRISAPLVTTDERVYKGASSEERVEAQPRVHGVFARPSHTGSLRPTGDVEDMAIADTMPPPPGVPIPELGLTEEEPVVAPPEDPPPVAAAPEIAQEIPETPEVAEEPPKMAIAPPADPAPAAEELDLDPDRRRRIDDLYVALDLLDHYQVLGVARAAAKDEVRSAYFQLSKVFHPDTMFRKKLGPYKAKMEAIFKRLTESYEVLGKKRAREEYDRYLALQDQTREYESEAAGPAAPEPVAPVIEPEPEPIVEAPEPAAPVEAIPDARARESSPEARARARELMAKKLRASARVTEMRRGNNTPQPPPSPSDAPVAKQDALRNLTSSLRESAAHTGGLDQLQRHVISAKRAEKDGDLISAARDLRVAVALAPDKADIRADYERVSAMVAAKLATSYEEQARYEQRHGKWLAAAISWSKVFEGRPTDANAARSAADALVEAKADLHKAKELAQKATELEPESVKNLRTLARVYIAAGLKLNAKRVLQRAATLDPKDQMVENLLRDLDR